MIDPIGSWRGDFRMAFLSALMMNIATGIHGKKGAKTLTPIDFMPDWSGNGKKEPQKQSVEQMKEFLMNFANVHNKRIKQQNDRKDRKPKSLERKTPN